MSVITGQVVTDEFTTANPTTAAAADADSTPTGTLYVDGVANGATVTVTAQAGAGEYQFSVTMPTLTVGQRVSVRIVATVAGVTGTGVVWRDHAETPQTGDAYAGVATLLTRITALIQTKAEADTAHALLATASALATAQTDLTTLLSRVTGAVSLATATTAAAIRAALGMAAANLDTQLDTLPTAAENADAIWDEALAGHATAGSAGKALSDAAASGNPWDTDIEGETFADGSAGDILQGLAGGTVYATGSTPNTDAALSIRNADTVAVTIGDLTGLAAGWDSLLVTIKKSKHDPDSAAILQVRVNALTPALPGIVYINGQGPVAAGVLATDAWISDVDGGADTLVLNIKPAASVVLPVRGALWWNVKQLDGTTWTSLATGEESAEITPGITQAIS